MSWLFLDLNSFFASVEQAVDPRLQNRPVAVVPMLADTTCCLAASYEAKAFGVKTGTNVREAKIKCPGIQFIKADHRKYISYHNQILAVVEQCLPIHSVLSIDEMACKLIGRECEDQNATDIANKIKNKIYKDISVALSCSIGIAPNRYLAKVASDMQKPNGLVIIKKEQIPKIFYRLTIRDFPGIGPRMERRFLEYGCLTVERLFQLSLEEMRKIWGGIVGEEFWQLIRGENLTDKITKKSTIGHSRVIAPNDRNNRTQVKAICMQLITKASFRLRDAGLFTKELHFSAKFVGKSYHDNTYHQEKIKFDETQNTLFLTGEIEKIFKRLPAGNILKISITLTNFVDERKHQLSLFEDNKAQSLMEALDRLNNKHGKNLIFPAASDLTRDRTPARIAFSRIPKENE